MTTSSDPTETAVIGARHGAPIAIKYKILGGHTHIEIRTGPTPGSRALCGRLVMDNQDASILLGLLEHGHASGQTHVVEGEEQ